ncbi:hypothetical protein CVD28_03940 [Bacillus sp. M6-12]|uniref:hypothetical protein n=1 Tax=Bacillus sp. M6-12 TaxID=2054166 RepID=UPI000C780739|nr:hypothetical protein [Bacillus sp. M6-12]PLS19578.1 hypothetical protein CVD28_03940 [Bacillus sp. M6-12]
MIEKILKDRLVSVELYEEKLKKDMKKIVKLKKSEKELVAKRAGELENSITEVLTFTDIYKKELKGFLAEGNFGMDKYQEKLSRYDDKFFDVLKFIQMKEDALKELE